MAFHLDRGGVFGVRELEQWPWLVHGFGTRAGHPAPDGMKLLTLRQIHSGIVRLADGRTPAGLRGDALVTRRPGLLLGIQTADCLPVLLVDPRRRVVAAAHAGWRGIARRVVEKTAGEMRRELGCRPEDLHAAIGPGIQACCFEVGREVLDQFGALFVDAERYVRREPVNPALQMIPRQVMSGQAHPLLHDLEAERGSIDLAEAARSQLLAAGLDPGRIYNSGECTSCHPRRYYSYRREKDAAGRMLAVIGIRE